MLDPVALHLGPLEVRWYGIAYALNLGICIWILTRLNKKQTVFKDNNQIYDFAFWVFLAGVILGGRLGYILFYNLPYYLAHPAKILAVWEGGMSIHGGMIGSIIIAYVLGKRWKLDLLKLFDLIAVPAAIADTLPRVANFINRELYGRIIENPHWQWLGVDFGDGQLRYPSQLFQSASSVVFFLIMLFIFSRKPKPGILLSSYFILYGLLRITVEFWRQPDEQLGFLWGGVTMGQLLSGLMVLAGVILLVWFKKGALSRKKA